MNIKAFLRRKPSVVIIVVALIVAVLLVVSRDRPAPLTRPERAWVVDVTNVAHQTIKPTLELFGSVQSPQDAELSSGIDGLITAVLVLDGQTVKTGEILLLIDDRDVRLTLQQAEADLLEVRAQQSFNERRVIRERLAFEKESELLKLTESRSARAEELAEEGLLSKSDLDSAAENLKRQQLSVSQAQLNAEEVEIKLTELSARISRAQALRDQARIDLERTRVQAPFDGVVSDLRVSQGGRVRGDDPLMRLQNPASIEVRTQVPARYAAIVTSGLREGQKMTAMVQAGEQYISGELARISGQTREASGGVDSFVRFGDAPQGLRLGSTVRVLLELPPQDNVIAVPAEAFYGRNQLYILDDDRMQMVEVERVGERVQLIGGTEVLVRSPLLKDDDQVVITKLSSAADGLLVQRSDAMQPTVGQTEVETRDGRD